MTDREIIQQALEALLHMCNTTKAQNDYNAKIVDKALVALEAALAQPEQELVEHLWECIGRWSSYLALNGEKANLAPPEWLVDAVKAATAQPEHRFDTPESHIVKWSIPVDPNNFGEPLAQPEQSKYSDIVSDGGLDPRNKFDVQPEQAEYDKFSFCGRVLDWNRKQEKPPIEIPKEYWVAQELWNLFYAAQPEQAPFKPDWVSYRQGVADGAAQPEREWVGLTDDEVAQIEKTVLTRKQAIKMIEHHLKEKNTK